MASDKIAENLLYKLRGFVRESAKKRLETAACVPDIPIEELEGINCVETEHWVAIIVISAAALRIKFRVHFTYESALKYMHGNPNLRDKSAQSTAMDFVREYCNLTAGAIKLGLQQFYTVGTNKDDEFVVNLPDQQVGKIQHSLEQNVNAENKTVSDCWRFNHGGEFLICASRIEIINLEATKKLCEADLSSVLVSDNGDIEFL